MPVDASNDVPCDDDEAQPPQSSDVWTYQTEDGDSNSSEAANEQLAEFESTEGFDVSHGGGGAASLHTSRCVLRAHVNLQFGMRSITTIPGLENSDVAGGLKAKVLRRINSHAKQAVENIKSTRMGEYVLELNAPPDAAQMMDGEIMVYRLPRVVGDSQNPKLSPLCDASDVIFRRPLKELLDAKPKDLGRRDTVTFRYVAKQYLSEVGFAGAKGASSTGKGGGGPSSPSRAISLNNSLVLSSSLLEQSTIDDAGRSCSQELGLSVTSSAERNAAEKREDESAAKNHGSKNLLYRRLKLYLPPHPCFGSIGIALQFALESHSSGTTRRKGDVLARNHYNFLDIRFDCTSTREKWWDLLKTMIGARLLQSVRDGSEDEAEERRRISRQGLDEIISRRPAVDRFVEYFRSDLSEPADVGGDGDVKVRDTTVPPDGGLLEVVFGPIHRKPRRLWIENVMTRGPDGVQPSKEAAVVEPHLVVGPANLRQRLRMVPAHAFPLRTLSVCAQDDQWGNTFYLERRDPVSVERSLSQPHPKVVVVAAEVPSSVKESSEGSMDNVQAKDKTSHSPYLRVELSTKSFVQRLKWMQWFTKMLDKPVNYVHDSKRDDGSQGGDETDLGDGVTLVEGEDGTVTRVVHKRPSFAWLYAKPTAAMQRSASLIANRQGSSFAATSGSTLTSPVNDCLPSMGPSTAVDNGTLQPLVELETFGQGLITTGDGAKEQPGASGEATSRDEPSPVAARNSDEPFQTIPLQREAASRSAPQPTSRGACAPSDSLAERNAVVGSIGKVRSGVAAVVANTRGQHVQLQRAPLMDEVHFTAAELAPPSPLDCDAMEPQLVAGCDYVWVRKPPAESDSIVAQWSPCRLCILQTPSSPPSPMHVFADVALQNAFERFGCSVGYDLCICVDWIARARVVVKPILDAGEDPEEAGLPTDPTHHWTKILDAIQQASGSDNDDEASCSEMGSGDFSSSRRTTRRSTCAIQQTPVLELYFENNSAHVQQEEYHVHRPSTLSSKTYNDACFGQSWVHAAMLEACTFHGPIEVCVLAPPVVGATPYGQGTATVRDCVENGDALVCALGVAQAVVQFLSCSPTGDE